VPRASSGVLTLGRPGPGAGPVALPGARDQPSGRRVGSDRSRGHWTVPGTDEDRRTELRPPIWIAHGRHALSPADLGWQDQGRRGRHGSRLRSRRRRPLERGRRGAEDSGWGRRCRRPSHDLLHAAERKEQPRADEQTRDDQGGYTPAGGTAADVWLGLGGRAGGHGVESLRRVPGIGHAGQCRRKRSRPSPAAREGRRPSPPLAREAPAGRTRHPYRGRVRSCGRHCRRGARWQGCCRAETGGRPRRASRSA
jgi:hypothetical protein